jgi:aryl-alcohol dehydrogenase-like predicted oxidoreductase
MQKRQLGKSNLQVSLVGLGCNNFGWRIDAGASRHVIDKAIEVGINFFDTSDSYGASEDIIGEVLGTRRQDIVLATKFGSPLDAEGKKKGASRNYIKTAVESSLRRLRTDWIDLYQLHFPDPLTPIEETLRALDEVVKQGKVRFIGCSNLSAPQLIEAQDTAQRIGVQGFVSTQNEYSVLVRGLEQQLAAQIERSGLALLPYFPLANGVLTGKYKPGQPIPKDARLADAPDFFDSYRDPKQWERAQQLQQLAAKQGRSVLDLAFSWLAARPAVSSIIAGATKPEQVEQNAKAAEWHLSKEDLAAVDRITIASAA